MNQFTRRPVLAFFAVLGVVSVGIADDWKAPAPAKTTRRTEGDHVVTVVNATPPGVVAVQGYGLASLAGDEDGFGFGPGWTPPQTCEVFDNRGPEDLGVFDQREPVAGKYDSICTFSGGWQQSFAVPNGGVGQFTVTMRILGSEGAATTCFWSPCGCTTATPQLLINGVDQPGFFSDPGCAHITQWSKTFQGADAAIAAGGTLNFQVNWNNGAFAIDWSKVSDVLPIVNIQLLDGDGQKAVIQNAAEKKLRVKLSCADPSTPVAGMGVTFTVTNHPPKATKYGVGADDKATTSTYGAVADANGIASAVIVVGDVEGQYTVEAKTPLATSGPVTFTSTAQKPDSTAILKDSTDIADKADSYALPADQPTDLFAFGLDKAGQKIGPVKCKWTTASSGSGATRGAGSVDPTTDTSSTKFTPSQVGQLTVSANSPISGIPTGKADLFLTKLYIEVAGFDPNNPVDQLRQFVPGSQLDGTSVPLASMPQPIRLHVLTGASSRGSVTFDLGNVTNYPGIAMNYPVTNPQSNPDMYFSSGASTTAQFSGSGDTVATLSVNDYAASGLLHVTIKSGKKTYSLKNVLLPVDEDGNHIADAGWRAEDAQINDTGLDPAADEDNTPPMTVSLPDVSTGIGDTLTNFEEYRGFVKFDAHFRTNPFHKDYFIEAAAFNDDIQYAYPALPTTTHRVSLSDFSTNTANLSTLQAINPNFQGLPGASNHMLAKAIHVDNAGGNVNGYGGITDCGYAPIVGSPRFPGLCSIIHIYTLNIAQVYPNDPVALRRAVLAHEAGHTINFFHHSTAGYLMYQGPLQSTGVIPMQFGVVPLTTVDCDLCNPQTFIPISGWDETSTIRIRP